MPSRPNRHSLAARQYPGPHAGTQSRCKRSGSTNSGPPSVTAPSSGSRSCSPWTRWSCRTFTAGPTSSSNPTRHASSPSRRWARPSPPWRATRTGASGKPSLRASAPQIRLMTPTLFRKAYELVDVLRRQEGEVDMVKPLHQLTVDVIGAVAFDADIGALRGEASELLEAWRRMMSGNTASGFWTMLQRARVPFSRWFVSAPTRTRWMFPGRLRVPAHRAFKERGRRVVADAPCRHGRSITRHAAHAQRMLEQKKSAIRAERASEKVTRGDFAGNDLITNLREYRWTPCCRADNKALIECTGLVPTPSKTSYYVQAAHA